MHRHKAVPAKMTFTGWSFCVTPALCAANPKRQAAHGALTHWDQCACGYARATEINMGAINYGPWMERRPDDSELPTDADSKYNVAKMEEARLVNTPIADLTEHEMNQLGLLASRRSWSPYNK